MKRLKPLAAAATLGAVLAAPLCAGCAPKKPANADAVAPAAKTAEPPKQASACEMVTESEMSAILGVTIAAKDTTHAAGETACTYSAASGARHRQSLWRGRRSGGGDRTHPHDQDGRRSHETGLFRRGRCPGQSQEDLPDGEATIVSMKNS